MSSPTPEAQQDKDVFRAIWERSPSDPLDDLRARFAQSQGYPIGEKQARFWVSEFTLLAMRQKKAAGKTARPSPNPATPENGSTVKPKVREAEQTRYRHVHFDRRCANKPWFARMNLNSIVRKGRQFATDLEAARDADRLILQFGGPRHLLNFPEDALAIAEETRPLESPPEPEPKPAPRTESSARPAPQPRPPAPESPPIPIEPSSLPAAPDLGGDPCPGPAARRGGVLVPEAELAAMQDELARLRERSVGPEPSVSQVATDSPLERELEAMRRVAAALAELDESARERVLRWAGAAGGLWTGGISCTG